MQKNPTSKLDLTVSFLAKRDGIDKVRFDNCWQYSVFQCGRPGLTQSNTEMLLPPW